MQSKAQYLASKAHWENEISILKNRLKRLHDSFAVAHCPIKIGDIIEENSIMRIRVEKIIFDNSYSSLNQKWWKATGQRLTKNNHLFRNANLPEIITFPSDLFNPRCNVKIIEKE